jgi:hypothetical protein
MFSPYHKMANCQGLQRTISKLHEKGNIPHLIFGQHKRYHYSLLHKLKSAKKHLENLQDVLENTEVSAVVGNSNDFINEVNMHIDSFFYCCGSAMDILAREVLIYYNISLPKRVYFGTARQQINKIRPGDPLLPKLQNPTWEQEFKNYRNSLTHEVLIGTNFNISVNADGGRSQTVIVYPLPDNPRDDIEARTFKTNPNAFEYCKTTFTRLLSLINTIYLEINTRATTKGSFPI